MSAWDDVIEAGGLPEAQAIAPSNALTPLEAVQGTLKAIAAFATEPTWSAEECGRYAERCIPRCDELESEQALSRAAIKLRDEQLAEARRIIEFDIERVQALEAQLKKEREAVGALIVAIRDELGPPTRATVLAIEAVRKSGLPQPLTAADPEAVNEYVAQRWVWDASYKDGGYWDDWPTQERGTLVDAAACAHLIRTAPNPHRARVVHRTQAVVPEPEWAPLALSDPRCRKPSKP